jgi:hypothetical protein
MANQTSPTGTGPQHSALGQFYDMVDSGVDIGRLTAATPQQNFLSRWVQRRRVDALYREMGEDLFKAVAARHREPSVHAEEQPTQVADGDNFTQYAGAYGVLERTGVQPGLLRQAYHHCEPVTAIVDTLVRYVQAFCQPPVTKRGYTKRPGFRIRMTVPEEEATEEDRKRMAELTRFMMRCGYARPPRNVRPIGWQPGLKAFAAQIVRDSFILDGAAIRRTGSKEKDGRGNSVVPLVSFWAEDGALMRKVKRETVAIRNGVRVTKPWKGERQNAPGEIQHVKVSTEWEGGSIVEEYTEEELYYAVRCGYADVSKGGYGTSETEKCLTSIDTHVKARRYNGSRFEKDSLPRGILSVFGNLNEQQFQSFRLHWQQLLSGEGKRWYNPILKGGAEAGSQVQWQPIDMSSRDMEYHQFLFTVALWIHATFGMHPEETGFEALSPFRPPLSEASPESKLESSQNKCLAPFLAWFADVLNEEILWKVEPSARYSLEFVGLGQGDEMADVQLRAALLGACLATPRQMLSEMDMPIPDALKNDKALDMLGTWAANHQLLLQMEMQRQQGKAADLQMQQQKAAFEQQQQMGHQQQAMQAVQQQAGQPGQPGQAEGPPGGPQAMFGRGGPGGPPGTAPEQQEQQEPMPPELQKALLYPYEPVRVGRRRAPDPRLRVTTKRRLEGDILVTGAGDSKSLRKAFREGTRGGTPSRR